MLQDRLRRAHPGGRACTSTAPIPSACTNYYSYLYNEAVYSLLEEERGKGDAVVFARSATAGGQKFPVHWGGDCDATFESMAETLRGGLSFGLSGGAFWSHDISGFNATATPELYKRWVAFGLFSSHSRLHGGHSTECRGCSTKKSVDVLRHFTAAEDEADALCLGASR